MFITLVKVVLLFFRPTLGGSSSGEILTPKDVSLSKSLSWLLRHGAIDEGLRVSEDGFIQLEDVLQHRLFARRCTPADIRRVVVLSKNRFTLRANPVTGIYEIRANSGHTFKDQNNNQEGQKAGVKSEAKQNRGRTIAHPGLRSGKNKNNHQSQKHKVDDLLKNYNIPVGNIASVENHKRRGKTNFYDSLMKYPELKKALLWILRYGSEKEGLTVKRHGYVRVDEILTHPYFKNKCMREDIITVANNEPHNFKLRESPSTNQLYVRARKEHPIKQDQEDWSVIPDVIYLPLGFVIHGINGSDWDSVSEHGLKVPKAGYLFCSPYYAADSWHTRGVTKYDDIYIYINCHAAMQDGVEFFLTPEYSVATKGDKDGFIRTQYFKKVIDAKTGTSKFSPKDLEKIFKKYGEIVKVQKQQIKPFAFIQFVDKDSVERALAARVFAGGKRLFVHRYDDNRNKPSNQEDDKEKSRKLSETLSNTSQAEGDEGKGPCLGVKELPVQIADPDWCSQEDAFLWQAQDFVTQVELPAEMYQSLNEVKSDVENLFQPVMPGCQVVVFGSCGSTLAFRNSDVDLFLQTADGEQPKDFVRREAKEMYRSRLFKVITRIPSARVPIVKFEHLRTGWQGDLTANSQLGVCNSQLIKFFVSLDPRIKPLIMVIKYWSKVCGVTGNHTRFTTYSLVMLVIFYLQQLDPPMLPTIAQLQQMSQHKQYSLGWQCSFCDEEWQVQSECLSQPNNLSLRELLTGFFRLYHNFDFSNVICPLLGKSIPVSDFESDDGSNLPDEMLLYREKLKSDPKCKFRTNVNLRMQDPFELCLNITRNVAERTCSVFKEACKVSLELCEKEEDAVILKSLFSIDEESLDVGEDCVKININYKEETLDSAEASESSFTQWYQLTTDSIMLVLKQIYKFSVDPYSGEVVSKVKKLESSQDVHTPISNHSGDKLIFVCSGKANIWNSRKKMSRFMNSINIALNPFEREVCISNALYYPSDRKSFYFTLTISSLEDLKKGGKGIEVQVNMKKCKHPLVKGFIQSVKIDFRDFVFKARAFINKVRSSSPLTELKESLKELFELKLENLPDLKELKNKKDELLSGKGKENKAVGQQKVLMGIMSKGEGSIDNESKMTPGFKGTSDKKNLYQKIESDDTKIPDQNGGQISPTEENLTSENVVENEVMKSVLSSKNMPSAETEILNDEFLKPTSPNQEIDFKKSSNSSESTEVDKFNNLLNAIQKLETQSTFTCDKVNPFLASIEKVALKPLDVERKTDKQDETEVKSAESESRNVENSEKLRIINEEKKAEKVETPQEPEYKSEESKNQGEVNADPYERCEGNVERESDNGKISKINEDLPSSSQENTDENKAEKEESSEKFINKHKSNSKMSLQRPKIHSERPLKQKKPNTNRFNRNAAQQTNQSWNGSPWQPWAGGGPPGCQPWHSQPQPHPPATHNSENHQGYQGNFHGGIGRHYPSNRNIQRQKKCYPGLFKDSKY